MGARDSCSGAGRWLLLYLPALILLALVAASADGILRFATPLLEVRWFLDRLTLGFRSLLYLLGRGRSERRFCACRRSGSPPPVEVSAQRRAGRPAAVYALLYALPYMFGAVPNHLMNLSVLSMGLIPLTWAYAITRYRLMDVDIIFQQGYVYTLATLAVIGRSTD